MRNFIKKAAAASLSVLIAASAAYAQTQAPKAVVVPDRFLRGYDPVTVLYDAALGPAAGGLVAGPSSFLSIEPAVDGEYRWDRRPHDPLPAVGSMAAAEDLQDRDERRIFLFIDDDRPASFGDAGGRVDEPRPFASIILTFPGALGEAALKKMLRIELLRAPRPGSGRRPMAERRGFFGFRA